MCGIAGVLALTDRPPDRSWGDLLVRVLRHRGPDGEGIYADSRAVFAHTRLAIIDVSDAGRQPMESADGRHLVLLNGEIYNHAALRPALEREGTCFRSRSDTEVLLTLLARRGPAALSSLLGMFAFAFYDREHGDLLLGRDRLGKRPLFFLRTREWFAFASEAAALLALPFARARLDPASVRSYLRYLYVPDHRSMLDGVEKLAPGSTLAIRAGSSEPPRPVRYWSPPPPDPDARGQADEAFRRGLEEDLLDSTRLRTVSDVPIGVFLSGGIDSNTVLALLHRVGHRPIRTFTVGFPGLSDERPLARLGAERYSDDHVELSIPADVTAEVPAIIARFGEPLGDSGVVTSYLIAREARRHVKVILNGDGGDELFGGYARYPFAARLDRLRPVPGGLAAARLWYRGRAQSGSLFPALARGDTSGAARILGSVLPTQLEERLVRPELLHAARPLAVEAPRGDAGLAGALFAWDTGAYLPGDLLYKADVAPMAHALENRSPFLDHRLFERLAALPPRRRVDPFRTKPILRRLARDWIPRQVLEGSKRGFQLPVESWLRGPLRPWLDGLLLDPQATGTLYRPGALGNEVAAFHEGRSDSLAPYRLWSLATLELWARALHVEIPA
ncbi:MAG: asparagine synthase (glutamine-hydrolyzing) [Bacteroidota bacterium]